MIGIGNPLRGDDGVGRIVAQQLREKNIPGLRVLEHQGETTWLMEAWEGADLVFVVDAISSSSPLGTIFRFDAAHPRLQKQSLRNSSHSLGLHEAVELARAWKRLPGKLIVYGITGSSFDLGKDPSPKVMLAARRTVDRIVAELRSLGSIPGKHRATKYRAGSKGPQRTGKR